MQESIQNVRAYYDGNAQKEWDRLTEHPFEFIFTTHMMEKHIRPGDSVLDIGGGPGRYAIHFARMGCPVTLMDLSEGNVLLAEEKAREAGVSIRALAANCLDLEGLGLGQFDHVLLMGPLYHLVCAQDREEAVRLALAHLKPGGVFYASFILEFAAILYDLKNGPGMLPMDLLNPATRRLIDCVQSGECYEGPAFTDACFFHQGQIEPFLAPFGLKKLALFGV